MPPDTSYVQAILPGALLWGLGAGLLVTPPTAAVHRPVPQGVK
jgi:hypothetical protein